MLCFLNLYVGKYIFLIFLNNWECLFIVIFDKDYVGMMDKGKIMYNIFFRGVYIYVYGLYLIIVVYWVNILNCFFLGIWINLVIICNCKYWFKWNYVFCCFFKCFMNKFVRLLVFFNKEIYVNSLFYLIDIKDFVILDIFRLFFLNE